MYFEASGHIKDKSENYILGNMLGKKTEYGTAVVPNLWVATPTRGHWINQRGRDMIGYRKKHILDTKNRIKGK